MSMKKTRLILVAQICFANTGKLKWITINVIRIDLVYCEVCVHVLHSIFDIKISIKIFSKWIVCDNIFLFSTASGRAVIGGFILSV